MRHETVVDHFPQLDPTECPDWFWECSCGEQGQGYRTGVAAEYAGIEHQIAANGEELACKPPAA